MSEVLQYILVIAITLSMFFLVWVFYIIISKDKELERENALISSNESLDNNTFNKFIARKIKVNKGKNFFTLIGIQITNYDFIEDTYGYSDANKIYKEIQYAIKDRVGSLAVIGNDIDLNTFYIYLPRVYTSKEINNLLLNIKRLINVKVKIFGDIFVNVEANISYLTYPISGNNVNDLITNLKLALYLAARSGNSLISAYSKEMDKDRKFIDFYYEIKNAIKNKEFNLYYQPIINIETNKVDGFETYVRWNHPEKGILPPNKFIQVLESSGDINWVGLWGIEEIFKTHLDLFSKHKKNYRFHVNFSHVQFLNNELIDELQKLIDKYRFNPEYLVIEIIDFETMINHEQALRTLIKLLNNNIKVATSIYNVNYQLLSDIEKHRINIIKLHNNILKEDTVSGSNFIASINELVGKKNMGIIIEAVETEADEVKIKGLNYKHVQGFYYSNPISKDEVIEYMDSNNSEKLN